MTVFCKRVNNLSWCFAKVSLGVLTMHASVITMLFERANNAS